MKLSWGLPLERAISMTAGDEAHEAFRLTFHDAIGFSKTNPATGYVFSGHSYAFSPNNNTQWRRRRQHDHLQGHRDQLPRQRRHR